MACLFSCLHLHFCSQSFRDRADNTSTLLQGSEEDIEMADAPDEFLDPITYTIMQDPVKLPSGAVMDRPNVLRMLLSDPRDPTTRSDSTLQ